MKRFAIMFTLFSSLAFGDPSVEALKVADELASVIGLKDQMESGFDAMLPMIEEQAKKLDLSPDQAKELKEIYRSWFKEDFDHEGLSKEIVRLYAETFTVEELIELIKFYETPLGKKSLKALPNLMAEGARLGMLEGQKKEQALLNRLEPFFENLKE